MRCVFRAGPNVEWIEDRDVTPVLGTEVEFVGVTYVVDEVSWWFGGPDDDLCVSDALIHIREREIGADAESPDAGTHDAGATARRRWGNAATSRHAMTA